MSTNISAAVIKICFLVFLLPPVPSSSSPLSRLLEIENKVMSFHPPAAECEVRERNI